MALIGENVARHILKSSVSPIVHFKTIELLCKDF